MIYLLCAILLFGFLHPCSKLILDSGYSTVGFAAFFVGLRLILTAPISFREVIMNAIDDEANEVLKRLIENIDRNLLDIVLEPGDIIIVDNYRAVHGRRSYVPVYDGSQRWMVRVNLG